MSNVHECTGVRRWGKGGEPGCPGAWPATLQSLKEDTIAQRTVNLPHRSVKGKLIWVWRAPGSAGL
eukprot:1148579-Pelagomonas_calceolata.AAC.6